MKYPNLFVDISKCEDTIDIEGKVHGQMKRKLFPSKPARRGFTNAIRQASNWKEAINITTQWVNLRSKK